MLEHIKRMFSSIANKIRAFFQKHAAVIAKYETAIVAIPVAVFGMLLIMAFDGAVIPAGVTLFTLSLWQFSLLFTLVCFGTARFIIVAVKLFVASRKVKTVRVKRTTTVHADCTTFHYPK